MSEENYGSTYARWKSDNEAFWLKAAQDIPWFSLGDDALRKKQNGTVEWFPDGFLNACYACVDHHVETGHGDQIAIQYESPITQSANSISYSQLLENVALTAGALRDQGIRKGDRVIIYMPMIPEAIFAMLACARLGAVHSVVFGGFSPTELASRIDDCEPKLILTASCGYEPKGRIEYLPIVREALQLASWIPKKTIVTQRTNFQVALNSPQELDAVQLMAAAKPAECTPVLSTDPLYILYTSGTTGAPKGVVRDTGGHMVSLKWSMKNIYNCNPGDVFWAASDIGWVVGHSYIVYGPLIQGATTILFEGKPIGTPNAGIFWSIIEKHRVKTLFTAPTAIRAIRAADPSGDFISQSDLSSLDALFLAGERADPPTVKWISEQLGVPVIDHWWQTELGWPALASCLGLGDFSPRTGSAGRPVPGFSFDILTPDGDLCKANENGEIGIKLPLPPGSLKTIWNAEHRFQHTYLDAFPGYYLTGDAGFKDEGGYVYVMGRTDDVINVAGHRLSTGSMEEIIAGHSEVNECAVVGIDCELKGQRPVGFVVLKHHKQSKFSETSKDLIQEIRNKIGPVADFKSVVELPSLPKTRSGKILRNLLRKMYQGEDYKTPATIEDAGALPKILTAITDSQTS